MEMELLKRIYILVLIYLLDVAFTDSEVKFSLSDGMVPEKGSDISMTCNFETTAKYGFNTIIISKGEVKLAECIFDDYDYLGHCTEERSVSSRYDFRFEIYQPFVMVHIRPLEISDAGNWYCGFNSTGKTLYTLQVYSSPKSIVLSGPCGSDLSIKGVNLTCETSNCVYPAHGDIRWFYKKIDSWLPYQNVSTTSALKTCEVYSSTLLLPKNTVWPLLPSNTDVTVKFQCRFDFPTLQSTFKSTESNDVRYAVRVTIATIYVASAVAANPLQVFVGESTTLTCQISTSRPAAIIVWYVGSKEIQRSSSSNFTFHPDHSENDKEVYCKAFNIQPENKAATSTKLTLHVQESSSVKSFFIGHNERQTNATFEELDIDVVLTCVVGGKPTSSVDIMFEGNILTRSSNTNTLKYSFQDISCTDAGDYICRSIDNFGRSSSKTVTVSVECAPRPVRQVLHNITSEWGVPVNLSVKVMAYPEPGRKGFAWNKEGRSIWISLLSNEDYKILSSGLETTLTITNVSREHFGKYRMTVQNSISSYDQILYLSGKDKTPSICTERSSSTLSIVLGVVCILLVGYSVGLSIMYKRNIHKKGPTSAFKSETNSSNENVSADIVRRADDDDDATDVYEDSSKNYTELAHYSNAQTAYDNLQF